VFDASPARADAVLAESLAGLRLAIDHPLAAGGSIVVSMPGAHQACNARVALAALQELRARSSFDRITRQSVAAGFAGVRTYTGLRGRIDTLRANPLIVADVGHNPDGVRTLVGALGRVLVGKAVVVFGVMKDKEYRAMARALAPMARTIVAVAPRTERALDCASIVEAFHAIGRRALIGGSVQEGLREALRELRQGETLLVAGSHYVVGEAMDALRIPE
jgi:dihydrofolate synthase/folylpolyglutamate synthase